MANDDLLERVMCVIEEHPENHNQQSWATADPDRLPKNNKCGSAYCFAGQTLVEAGYGIRFDKSGSWDELYDPAGRQLGLRDTFPDVAAKLLDLDDHWRITLFAAGNGRRDLRAMVNAIKASQDAATFLETHKFEDGL